MVGVRTWYHHICGRGKDLVPPIVMVGVMTWYHHSYGRGKDLVPSYLW